MNTEQLLNIVKLELEEKSQEDRIKFFNELYNKFCIHCGRDHSDSIIRCQCDNDD